MGVRWNTARPGAFGGLLPGPAVVGSPTVLPGKRVGNHQGGARWVWTFWPFEVAATLG